MQKQLKKMLDSLTDRQREAVYLRYTQGLSYEEIGKLMGIQPKAAQKLVYAVIFCNFRGGIFVLGVFLK